MNKTGTIQACCTGFSEIPCYKKILLIISSIFFIILGALSLAELGILKNVGIWGVGFLSVGILLPMVFYCLAQKKSLKDSLAEEISLNFLQTLEEVRVGVVSPYDIIEFILKVNPDDNEQEFSLKVSKHMDSEAIKKQIFPFCKQNMLGKNYCVLVRLIDSDTNHVVAYQQNR